MYRSTLPSTSALDGGGWSTLLPDRFTPGKESRYPLYRRLGGPHGRSGRVRKISPPTGIRSSDRPARSKSLIGVWFQFPLTVYCEKYEGPIMSYSHVAMHSTCTLSASQTFLENVTYFCSLCAAAVHINSAVNLKTETQLLKGVFVENLHVYQFNLCQSLHILLTRRFNFSL